MFWKTLFITILVVGAFAEDNPSDQYDSTLSYYCRKYGAADKTDEVKASITTFIDCVKELINFANITSEVEEAKKHGNLDEVFKKYCAKAPQLKTCWYTLLEDAKPCLDSAINNHMEDVKNGTSQLINFICYKDGDRIALFYAESGPDCLQSKVAELRDCFQKMKDSIPTVEAAKSLNVNEQCQKYDTLTSCVVKALEQCDTPTPGNMAESLFKYIRNSSPCPKKK